jgi:hypothetical protein
MIPMKSSIRSRHLDETESEHAYSEWKPKQDNAGLQNGGDILEGILEWTIEANFLIMHILWSYRSYRRGNTFKKWM